jgi:hypothetical protein
MKIQIVDPEDRIWILTRIGYFLGEYLNQVYGGLWFVDEDVESPYFLQYVIGSFLRLPNPRVRLAPFALAALYVEEPPGRSLIGLVDRVAAELEAMPPRG